MSKNTESTSLLHQPINEDPNIHRKKTKHCQRFCLPSKSATLMLFGTAVVGTVYYFVLIATVALIDSKSESIDVSLSTNDFLAYAILAIIAMVYPFSGFIADVYCGRLKTVQISLLFILTFALLLCLGIIIVYSTNLHFMSLHINLSAFHLPEGIVVCIIILVALAIYIIGLAGYQANFIQLGLDQLFEAPSHYLSLFILYTIWMFNLGSVPMTAILTLLLCDRQISRAAVGIYVSIPFITSVLLIVLLTISWKKRHWFYVEPGHTNPYKTLFKVIKFAKKNKYPLQRSAFTYGDNYLPSRIDFAKQRYGGPFTTEQVENVKTFVRIVIVLLAVGPLFTIGVPASYFVFPIFGFHTLHHPKHKKYCTGEYLLLGSGNLMNILSMLVVYPVFIWVTVGGSCKRIRGFFTRIFIGAILCLVGVTSMAIVDVVGHALQSGTTTSNHTQCMFQVYRTNSNFTTFSYPSLNMHWSVLIPPSIFLGFGPVLIMTASLEFISAQSPQSMKGFLIGIFFAVRGLFQFLNSSVTLAFSLKHPWDSGKLLENPPVTNCGFVYFLFTIVVGVIGLLLFSIAAKKYKYRKRDEGLFRQQDVEDVYERYLSQAYDDSTQY